MLTLKKPQSIVGKRGTDSTRPIRRIGQVAGLVERGSSCYTAIFWAQRVRAREYGVFEHLHS